MVTITQKTINLQAEGQYGEIKVQGGASVAGNQIGQIYGSVFRDDHPVGNFSSGDSLTITLDNKENANLMPTVSEAITTFVSELSAEILTPSGEV